MGFVSCAGSSRVVRYEGGVLGIGTDRDGRSNHKPQNQSTTEHMVGFDLVTSDGTSLLGGDDKAGGNGCQPPASSA